MIARGENRGLGIQSWEAYRALDASALLVDMGPLARGFPSHPERYPTRVEVPFDGELPEDTVRDWLGTVDVVYAPETLYDWRLADWARDMGVPTVVHINPEFFHPQRAAAHPPTRWWAPTPWRMAHLADGTELVGMPVAADRFPAELDVTRHDGPLRVVHVAGHRASGDRNGTTALLAALRLVRRPLHVKLLTQDPRLPRMRAPRHVTIEAEFGGRPDYWSLYRDADVLVMPRRYGGLCLPVQEAMAAGLAVVMPDVTPNGWWPTLRVRARERGALTTPTGEIPMADTDPSRLAALLDQLGDPADSTLEIARLKAFEWGTDNSWDARRHEWRTALGLLG